jgi:hypothetical protein
VSNIIEGGVPSKIGWLSNLKYIEIGKWNPSFLFPFFTGKLNSFASPRQFFETLPSIKGSNQLTRKIPSEIGKLVKLQFLDLGTMIRSVLLRPKVLETLRPPDGELGIRWRPAKFLH